MICGKYERLSDSTDSLGSVRKAVDTDSIFVQDVSAAHVEHKEKRKCVTVNNGLLFCIGLQKETYCILFNIDQEFTVVTAAPYVDFSLCNIDRRLNTAFKDD